MNRSVRAALYSRVSTEEQAEHGTSLSDQVRRTEAYCVDHGWTVAARYSDEGVSGATVERPALKNLIAGASAGEFDVVVVTDPDRLSRDLVDGLVVERELDQARVRTVYLVQPSMGTLERQLRGVIAEEERRKIRDRTSRGLRAVATEGSWPGGPPPYGYRISVDDTGGRRKPAIDPAESEVLRWMIDLLVGQRMTTWDVAAELNARGVPTAAASRKVTNAGSPRWTHRRVRDLLVTAKAIAGTWTYKSSVGTIKVDIPPIVTVERLAQLQGRLSETSTGKGATLRRNEYLLAGRLTSQCGATMHGTAKPGGGTRVYLCWRSPKVAFCDQRKSRRGVACSSRW
jgi:site-specific DNA recombinase